MNWFDTSGLTSLAKTALKEAQKTIDKALDIQDESSDEQEEAASSSGKGAAKPEEAKTSEIDSSDIFSAWGLTVSAESNKDAPQQPVVTESPSKGNAQSLWGSFAGSFFEPQNSETVTAIVKPPKAKSMNLISDKFDSQDDLFSKSQLVMSDGAEAFDPKTKLKEDLLKEVERRGSTRSHRLSLVSSRNSSDSVEVLSQSLKTTPDSEAASALSISHSSSYGQKLNSDSVEILPDSLISPSSIECLGFDSYSSDKDKSTSSGTPGDFSDNLMTPVGERTERVETADSVSLVVDDDEDTMSYNSISECTAPTVLDTDEKIISPFQKPRDLNRKGLEKELLTCEPVLIPQKMQISGNSSNDGSWSDRTLNADNDSINLENVVDEAKKEAEPEDILIEKLSDSSSFYNINMSNRIQNSESSAFVNVEKRQCDSTESSKCSEKGSSKESKTPESSDGKNDIVKIGSDRTSGHTSGDEIETTTSSDIEIIPSPNGESGFRHTPVKCTKQSTSPNLVDLVLGKTLATKIRGHNRELSEASIQSNISDESQGSENERLMRRLCEMAEVLEARENRLMEVSTTNAELEEKNADLKFQLDSLTSSLSGGDVSSITEDYTQRMSALEKKFQQTIREKDQLRKQLEGMQSSRKISSEFENSLREKDEVISQMQEEGEKLAKQQLQHSNIIKKLRNKEKDNEQVIKGLRDKISELTAELERLKRSVAAKEEVEVSQIEAVYRLTTSNNKASEQLAELMSQLEDTTQRLAASETALAAARAELGATRRALADGERRKETDDAARRDLRACERDRDRLRDQLQQLRVDMVQEEKRWKSREESLRRELNSLLEAGAGGEGAAGAAGGEGAAALLGQLAALQQTCLQKDQAMRANTVMLNKQRAEAETCLAKAAERERVLNHQLQELQQQVRDSEGRARDAGGDAARAERALLQLRGELHSKSLELERLKSDYEAKIEELERRVSETELQLASERTALDTERKRNAALQQEQLSCRDLSPPQSVASETLSASLWTQEEGFGGGGGGGATAGVEALLGEVQRLEGQLAGERAARDVLRHERDAARHQRAAAAALLQHAQSVQEQYDALLQMYGEKEEQAAELALDLADVTALYKNQLNELIQLKQQLSNK